MLSLKPSTVDSDSQSDALRRQLLDRIWLGIFVIAIIGLPASLSRVFLLAGWTSIRYTPSRRRWCLLSLRFASGSLIVLAQPFL